MPAKFSSGANAAASPFPRRNPVHRKPLWLSDRAVAHLAQLARAGGLSHDLGKGGQNFQDKLLAFLKGGIGLDPVHHSWVSMRLVQVMRERGGFDAAALDGAWKKLARGPVVVRDGLGGLKKGLRSHADVLDFLVGTHHRLYATPMPTGFLTDKAHVDPSFNASLRPHTHAGAVVPVSPKVLGQLAGAWRAVLRKPAGSPSWHKANALFARLAMIVADHSISSAPGEGGVPGDGSILLANTDRTARMPRQGLDAHLLTVGGLSADVARQMMGLRFAPLSPATVRRIMTPGPSRFAWQERAVRTLRAYRDSDRPTLVLNLAGTGSGKTIGNAKMACALRSRDHRFSIALNLRSLTLQTGRAMAQSLNLLPHELTTEIGDKVIKKLDALYAAFHEHGTIATTFDAEGRDAPLPAWTDILAGRHPNLGKVLHAPVLVSTIDHLIKAGEPGEQARHAVAMLRLMHSDLIIDEIDGYDPPAMGAVLRLIQMAAMCGRNVICSSATLPLPIARAVYRAFMTGTEMYLALRGRTLESAEPTTIFIHDQARNLVMRGRGEDPQNLDAQFAAFTQRIARLPVSPCRHARLVPVTSRSIKELKRSVIDEIRRLHHAHAWDCHGHQVSFGLVRVANIRFAIDLAREIATSMGDRVRVACYHANDLMMQRRYKEERLDFLLTRKNAPGTENDHIKQDPEICRILAGARGQDVIFIVVATPVEEVGRDHDFDWGIIEPSSMHSIIQTSGRINRHRNLPVAEPNIGLLQFNAKWAAGRPQCFFQPGLETDVTRGGAEHRPELSYRAHELPQLLPFDQGRLDVHAGLRFDASVLFSSEDDRLIETRLAPALAALANDTAHWMGSALYREFCLRADSDTEAWRVVQKAGQDVFEWFSGDPSLGRQGWLEREVEMVPRVTNDWLTLSTAELITECRKPHRAIRPEDGLKIHINRYSENAILCFDASFGFSFHSR